MSVLSGKFGEGARADSSSSVGNAIKTGIIGLAMVGMSALPSFNANAHHGGPHVAPPPEYIAAQSNEVSSTGISRSPQVATALQPVAQQQRGQQVVYSGGIEEVESHSARHPNRVAVSVLVGENAPLPPHVFATVARDSITNSAFVRNEEVDVFLKITPGASGASFETYIAGFPLKGGPYSFSEAGVTKATSDISVVRGWSSQVSSLNRDF